jgi:hypothetical protein
MTTRKSKSRLIADRRKTILAELSRIAQQTEALQQELEELNAAERTLARLALLMGEAEETDADETLVIGSVSSVRTPSVVANPDLTLREMCESLLREHKSSGLTTTEMLDMIRVRWRPNVDPNHVRPLAWRMVKDGKWAKTNGGKLFLLNKNSEPSETNQTAPSRI